VAEIGAAFLDEPLRFSLRPHVIEDDPRSGANEQADSRRTNAAGSPRDEGNSSRRVIMWDGMT